MKILKYIAVLAAIALSGAVYAAPAEPVVSTSINDGVLSVSVQMNVSDPMVSSDDAIKAAVTKALQAIGMDSVAGKAVNSAIAAIKGAIADKNLPAKGNVKIAFQVKQRMENGSPIADVKTNLELAGNKYEANTTTAFAPDSTAKTTGNVVRTDASGAQASLPVELAVASNGMISGNVGGSTVAVADKDATTAERDAALTASASSKDTVAVPDNTVVSSGTRQ